MIESNEERALRIAALLRSLPADSDGARGLAQCLRQAAHAPGAADAWYETLDGCGLDPAGSRLEGERLRVRCSVCRDWMWTRLAAPHDECARCHESPSALHPGFGTPHDAEPSSERQFNGSVAIECGQGE